MHRELIKKLLDFKFQSSYMHVMIHEHIHTHYKKKCEPKYGRNTKTQSKTCVVDPSGPSIGYRG